jgi:hypothetical protein
MTKTRPQAEVYIASGACSSRFRHRAENESVSGRAKNCQPRPTNSLRCNSYFSSARSNLQALRMRRKGGCSKRTTNLVLASQGRFDCGAPHISQKQEIRDHTVIITGKLKSRCSAPPLVGDPNGPTRAESRK